MRKRVRIEESSGGERERHDRERSERREAALAIRRERSDRIAEALENEYWELQRDRQEARQRHFDQVRLEQQRDLDTDRFLLVEPPRKVTIEISSKRDAFMPYWSIARTFACTSAGSLYRVKRWANVALGLVFQCYDRDAVRQAQRVGYFFKYETNPTTHRFDYLIVHNDGQLYSSLEHYEFPRLQDGFEKSRCPPIPRQRKQVLTIPAYMDVINPNLPPVHGFLTCVVVFRSWVTRDRMHEEDDVPLGY